VGETLSSADAYFIGRAFATFLPEGPKPIVVGRDGRLSSPDLEEAFIQGLQEAGRNVCSIGLASTPLLYYTVFTHASAGGAMITGSHNPSTHNGIKLMQGRMPLSGRQIQKLGRIAASGQFSAGKGVLQSFSPHKEYRDRLLQNLQIPSTLRVAWDTGNGAVGPLLQDLLPHLPCPSFLINAEVDGRFPHHPPDPSLPENLQDLQALIREKSCDVGFAFDGDGDRIAVVDETGQHVATDDLLILFSRDLLSAFPGATVIADVKTSQSFFNMASHWGGKPIMERTGHSRIKSRLQETGALLAGELSGHFFFADHWYGFDDGLYTALRFLNLLGRRKETVSSLVRSVPQIFRTEELSFPCPDADKMRVIRRVAHRLRQEGIHFLAIDGVRVITPQGWWLLRASNTQDLLTGRVEASSSKARDDLLETLKAYLQYGREERACHPRFSREFSRGRHRF
jgi:phosphomannomutase